MSQLLESIRTEIRERLDELRPAAEEAERLETALAALGGPIEESNVAALPTREEAPEQDQPLAA